MVNPSSLVSAASVPLDGAGAAGEVARSRVGRTAACHVAPVGPKASSFLLAPAAMEKAAGAPAIVRGRPRRAAVAGWAAAPGVSSKPAAGARATSSSRTTSASKASAAKASSSSTAASTSSTSLAFLSDPKLSIEEKLMRLMAYLNAKYEKEMQAKMEELGGKAPKSTSTSSAKKKGGILGAIGSAVSSVIGGDAAKAISGFLKLPGVKAAIGKLAGPVLAAGATALGFPAAAPLLLQYGSKVVDVAAGVLTEAASSSSGSSGTSATSASGTEGKNEQLAMMELQRLQEKQREMFSLVSNILRAGHDTRMTAINNLR